MYDKNSDSEFERIKENGIFYGYCKRTKLSNGQTAAIFFGHDSTSKITEWSVGFMISNKKKYINAWLHDKLDADTKITGKCGLEGLIWAKNSILKFEKFIREKDNSNNRIIILWTDNKREKAYKYLERYGYKMIIYYGKKTLVKDLF